MTFVFDPPPCPSVAVAGEGVRFPVRRIFCVGRNYAKHALEMGSDPDRQPPFFFSKPADAVVDAGVGHDARIAYPPQTDNFHHEVELAVALGRGGADISTADALDHVFGYAVALDLTRRDLQKAAREKGHPWDFGKAFDRSAPIAPLHRAADMGHPAAGRIWLRVDDEVRQDADLGELIWPVPDVISILSRSMTLAPGDLILTGTPAGVGPLLPGHTVRGGIEGLEDLELQVTERGSPSA
ncbi:MAG: fumarylacetoacetate hydrolase family protein [Deltaproteobacteria bacterium]|nr:fumarylacetoacetate hydrolase family protein [Deltaproteobacteria bacterium]